MPASMLFRAVLSNRRRLGDPFPVERLFRLQHVLLKHFSVSDLLIEEGLVGCLRLLIRMSRRRLSCR